MSKWIAEFELEDGDTMPEHMDLEYKGARIDFHCKPLEQEPTTKNSGVECVSRQAVDALVWEYLRKGTDEHIAFYEHFLDLPSVTPQEPRWIPVSERLPQEAFGCLVTVIDTDVHTQEEFENILPYFVGYDGETWNDLDGEAIPFEVIAWMPLPKAYREVVEE